MSDEPQHGETLVYITKGQPPEFVIVLRYQALTSVVLLANGHSVSVATADLKYPAVPT